MGGLVQRIAFYPSKLGGNQVAETGPKWRQGIKRVGLNRGAAGKRGYGDLKAREQRKVWRLVAEEMASR